MPLLHVLLRATSPLVAALQEVRQHALRLLQCRLLLLTHASTCSKEGGSCQLAPLCDSVRQLLQHLQCCRDQ